MEPKQQGLLLIVQELVTAQKGAEALVELENIDETQLAEDELGWYYLLCSEAAIQSGRYELAKLDEADEAFASTPGVPEYAHVKFLQGRLLSETGQHLEARRSFWESYLIYLRLGSYSGQVTVLNNLAHCEFRTGNLIAAQDHLSECISFLERSGRHDEAEMISKNLALVYGETGKISESLRLLRRAFKNPRTGVHPDRDKLAHYLNWAYLQALCGNFIEARAALDRSEEYVDDYQREKGLFFAKKGLTEMLAGDLDAARKALAAGHEIAVEIAPGSTLEVEITRLRGELALAENDFIAAEKFAQDALALAIQTQEKVEQAACHRILAQVKHQKGDQSGARQLFDMSLDMFVAVGNRYRVAQTRLLAAESGLYDREKTRALVYNAREYFESESIQLYSQRIDQIPLGQKVDPRPRSVKDAGPHIISRSEIMVRVKDTARRAAPSRCTVLLTGETGTGKDLLARFIHLHSGREGEFVSLNAAAVPIAMIESELFGYRKGAFTGADRNRTGLLEQADQGTFFLNEIADSSPELQAKLLEVIETGQVRRLGENRARQIDIRMIAATNHDLQTSISEGQFRNDLFHRLNELPITLPPLAERRSDIPCLVEHFVSSVIDGHSAEPDRAAVERLSAVLSIFDYPGNVRELKARVKQLAVLAGGDLKHMIDLALEAEPEKSLLVRCLKATNWNRSRAAIILGIDEATVRRRIKKHDLIPD